MAAKTISAGELAKHTTSESAWVAIHGNVYDVTDWMHHHPGGDFVFEQALGKDITWYFESSHVLPTSNDILGSAKCPLVGKYDPSDIKDIYNVEYKWPSPFYSELKTKVSQMIKESKENPRQVDLGRFLNFLFIMVSLLSFTHLTFYGSTLLFGTAPSFALRVACAAAAGLFSHLFMTHIAHDMGHTSFGDAKSKTFWYNYAYINDFCVGLSRLVWSYRHNLGHHIYTNVKVADPDISYYHDLGGEEGAVFYKAPLKVELPVYVRPLLYTVGVMLMKMEEVIGMIRGRFGIITMNKHSFFDIAHFWVAKFWFVFYRLVLPVYVGQSLWQTVFLFFTIEATNGLIFTLFSQLNHVNTNCDFVKSSTETKQLDWAIMQVKTSVDYCHDSIVWTYLSGYLNHQVSHHLFPTLNPALYPKISRIAQQVCKEHNVTMNITPTFVKAVSDHFTQLDILAKLDD